MIARRAIGRSCEVRIAESAASATRGAPARAVLIQIENQLVRVRIENLCSYRHSHNNISAVAASAIAAFAVQTAPGNVLGVVTEMEQCVQRRVGNDPNVA